MVHVLLSLCLTGAVCPSVTRYYAPASPSYAQPEYAVPLETGHGNEVHSVIVDMPQVATLEFASPETWYRLGGRCEF